MVLVDYRPSSWSESESHQSGKDKELTAIRHHMWFCFSLYRPTCFSILVKVQIPFPKFVFTCVCLKHVLFFFFFLKQENRWLSVFSSSDWPDSYCNTGLLIWFVCACVLCMCLLCACAQLHLSSISFPFLGSISRLKLKRQDFFPPLSSSHQIWGTAGAAMTMICLPLPVCLTGWEHAHMHAQTLTQGDTDTH